LNDSLFALSGLPTMVGSMPHTDPHQACSLVAKFLPEIPTWPQLPKRSFSENMYAQCSEGFPGLVIDGDRIYVNLSDDFDGLLEQFYLSYINKEYHKQAISQDYAASLHEFLKMDWSASSAVKGQVTGPITWGLVVTDEKRRPIIYDDALADAVAKHLNMKTLWMQDRLRHLSPATIIFLDEPYMSSIGSAFVSIPKEQIAKLLNDAFSGIDCMKGIHCCGNTDWSMLLTTSIDILNFDAYNYGYTIALYPEEVKAFLERGGVLAWGIVGRDEDNLNNETVDSLIDRLTEEMSNLEKKGVPFRRISSQCLITPSCGLGTVSVEAAEWALELLAGVSKEYRKRYVKG
jgi:methionine synthase II (cobalamin-independent)